MRALIWTLALGLSISPAHAQTRPVEAELQAAVDTTLAAHPELPSIALTVLSPRGGIDWTGASGRIAFKGAPLKSPPAFRIASVTKSFVAAATLRLIEDGKFALTDSIGRLVAPETAEQLRGDGYDPDAITIRHLLEHSSGIFNYVDDAFVQKVASDPRHIWTRREQIAYAMAHGEPVNEPGAAFHYSDTGYVILGEIIERATGEPLPQATRRLNKFAALGIDTTWFETQEPAPAGAPPLAHQYYAGRDMTDHHPSFDLYGGGGLVSTTRDLARYFRALSLGWIFDRPETLAMGLTAPDLARKAREVPHTPLMMVYTIGRHRCWGHGGFFGTVAVYCPDIDTAIAVSVNANTGGRNTGINEVLGKVDLALAERGIR